MQALTLLGAAYRPLLELADTVTDESGWRATRLPGWTVRDLLFHLAGDSQRALVAFGTPAPRPPVVLGRQRADEQPHGQQRHGEAEELDPRDHATAVVSAAPRARANCIRPTTPNTPTRNPAQVTGRPAVIRSECCVHRLSQAATSPSDAAVWWYPR